MVLYDEDYQNIVDLLKKRGATKADIIPTTNVQIDERVRLKCRVPLCPEYEKNMMCPPNTLEVGEFRKILEKFREAILIQVEQPLTEEQAEEEARSAAALLHQLVNLGEEEAFKQGYRFATGFIGGACHLCDTCIGAGNICQYPLQARPSMEAVGIDVIKTAEITGWQVDFPVEDKVIWIGLILLN